MDAVVNDSELTVESFRPIKAVKASSRRPVCLVMIVKNEESTIERCLRSVTPFIDTYSICDVGSTDNTKGVIREVMKSAGVEGVIRDHPWENFGHNKTLSLLTARKHCPRGWSWVLEADEVIRTALSLEDTIAAVNGFWDELPGYVASIKIGGQHRIFSNDKEWYYKGKVLAQPQLDCESASEDFSTCIRCESLGGQPSAGSLKEVQSAAYLNECSVFQLAKECQSKGVSEKAQELYKQCVASEKSALHEKYMACVELLNYTSDTQWAWKAIELDSSRLDAPYYALTRAVDSKKLEAFTMELIGMGLCLRNRALLPAHTLAWEPIYTWRFSDVFSIALFWKGFHRESAEEALRALAKCPQEQKGRIEMNLKFATDAMKSAR